MEVNPYRFYDFLNFNAEACGETHLLFPYKELLSLISLKGAMVLEKAGSFTFSVKNPGKREMPDRLIGAAAIALALWLRSKAA
jgi:hypothetical protein